ncbi:hypothetical protein [Streptomyces albidoflavus]|uniref:hypothetical protein n=1 Tax=Streptomyces albidoflavus TaxID=1886 RepID=UPI0015C7C155|nr:hypothetical protein [Streptomyces albidoflavus]
MADENTPVENETPETGEVPETGEQGGEQPQGPGGTSVPPAVERALRKANEEAKTLRLKLKEFEDRDKTEAERLAERASEAEKRASTAEQGLLRWKVAAAKKLPPLLADRLQGDDEEAMAADADRLLQSLKAAGPSAPSFDGGVRPTARPSSMNDLIRRQAGLG